MRLFGIGFNLVAVLAVVISSAAAAQLGFDALISEPTGEELLIEGLLEVEIDDIVWDHKVIQSPEDVTDIDLRESARGNWRLFGPGSAHWGNASITVQSAFAEPLLAWFTEATTGKNIRKNIQIWLYASDKKPGRTYVLRDCFPVQWNAASTTSGGLVQSETLHVSIGRIEFQTRTLPSGGNVQVGIGGEYDRWESWGDGESQVILPSGGDKFRTNSPGHKTVSEITLRGAMTDGRKNLCQWINDSLGQGNTWRESIAVTEISTSGRGFKKQRQYTYHDCFPVRYVFPRMSVTNTNTNTNTTEEFTIKPIRVELK